MFYYIFDITFTTFDLSNFTCEKRLCLHGFHLYISFVFKPVQGASRMRGRLGSMGSLSSFERVSDLEGEHENSQNFAPGTLGILTFNPVAQWSFSQNNKWDSHAFTLINVTWRHYSALHYSHKVSWCSCFGLKSEEYSRECVYRAVREPFGVVGSTLSLLCRMWSECVM